ncbi:polysaccharide export protein [Sulfurifustis variabilis]|uniref:Polysaccharide export protein n=1 Tax=Sulfurifustis variabilis TaxID=1675686 RepID=A0A1B4V9A0_9GAMM|nr:polysaccharide biosynthesis/export family protein [Sulfurifustis variabilis]BAU48044.1 polysaccharide export protein [Sulfurifustis variabilis]
MAKPNYIRGAFALLTAFFFLSAYPPSRAVENETRTESGNTAYTVQPGDLLEIFVWKEKDLQREVIVRPDGGLSFPLIGDMQVAGKTVSDIRGELTEQLREYVSNPTVSVSVKQAQGYKIYVMGQVNRPGEFTAVRPVDVVQALSMAGGLNPFAAANSIKVLRRENGVETAIPFKYGQVESGRKLEQNIILHSGDVVVVP